MSIAVTGIGIISAIGNNAEETLASLKQQRSGIGRMKYLSSSHKDLPVGEVKLSNNEMRKMLNLEECREMSRTTMLGVIAVNQALADASLSNKTLAGKRVALISGTTVGGMDVTERLFKEMQADDTLLEYIKHHDCGSCTNDIARLCALDCECITISTACSSALNAIIQGCEMLKNDEVDIVVAGGTEALSKFHLNGFNTLMILDKELCRPFDDTRAGLNLGEGAAYVVLMKESAHALAYINGYGNRCDAFHQTASSDNGEGAYLAMRDALQMACLSPSDVDYINAHGTGTPSNDISENVALQRVFGQSVPPVSSTKVFTGHTTSASGSIETVISILAMRNGFIPANLGWKNPIKGGITPSLGENDVKLRNIVCNSFGFGGNDSSIVISSMPKEDPLTPASYEVAVHSLSILAEAEQLKDIKDFLSPMAARRMGKMMKAAMLTSLKALKAAGIESPDAIITATAYGMLETSETFLREMCENGEETLSPTLFMQSTHNTLGSAIAIRTKCHGYNITYTQGERSLELALRDARRLIMTGKAKNVLVGLHEESTPLFNEVCRKLGVAELPLLYSKSIVLRRK